MKLKSKDGILMVLSHTFAQRKIEALPAAPPKSHRHIHSKESSKIREQHKQSAQDLLCFDKGAGPNRGEEKNPGESKQRLPNSYSSGKPRGRSRTELSTTPRRKPSPAEREREGRGVVVVRTFHVTAGRRPLPGRPR
jgi:hypothetical protein